MTKKIVEIAFMTPRLAEMTEFYRRFLGQEPDAAWPGGAIFWVDGIKLFIHETYEQDENHPLPPVDHIAFGVTDIDKEAGRISDRGIDFEFPPTDYDWGRSAYARDPDGHQLEITRLESRGE